MTDSFAKHRDWPRPGHGDASAPPATDPHATDPRVSALGGVDRVRGAHTSPLWSRRSAEQIETFLREDLAHGHLRVDEAAELIARVWARAQPDTGRQTRRPAAELLIAEHLARR